ncbi:hypothetical protein GCM10010277_52880 [Streptomyces longisporoflavus]|nr:hypothetical protein GCM10010277_52880 [Streptomyces longisporoflavus]
MLSATSPTAAASTPAERTIFFVTVMPRILTHPTNNSPTTPGVSFGVLVWVSTIAGAYALERRVGAVRWR